MPPDPHTRRLRPARALWLAVALVAVAGPVWWAAAGPPLASQVVASAAARVWALVALVPLALLLPHRLENENRQRILAYLEKHPGASIQQVRLHLGIAWGTAVYHLDRLRKDRLVVNHRQGNHHRYWLASAPAARLRSGWSVLQQPTARDIAMAVAATPGMHQSAICDELDVRAPNASKHLSRLERHGLVAKRRISRFAVYEPTPALHELLEVHGTDPVDRSGAHLAPAAIRPAASEPPASAGAASEGAERDQ